MEGMKSHVLNVEQGGNKHHPMPQVTPATLLLLGTGTDGNLSDTLEHIVVVIIISI